MKILVCGSRDWDDAWIINRVLAGIYDCDTDAETRVVHGAARGADRLAKEWAEGFYVGCEVPADPFPADWKQHGKAAGPIRNQKMLDEGKPDVVLAFRCEGESRGTDDMVSRAATAGIPTYVIRRAS